MRYGIDEAEVYVVYNIYDLQPTVTNNWTWWVRAHIHTRTHSLSLYLSFSPAPRIPCVQLSCVFLHSSAVIYCLGHVTSNKIWCLTYFPTVGKVCYLIWFVSVTHTYFIKNEYSVLNIYKEIWCSKHTYRRTYVCACVYKCIYCVIWHSKVHLFTAHFCLVHKIYSTTNKSEQMPYNLFYIFCCSKPTLLSINRDVGHLWNPKWMYSKWNSASIRCYQVTIYKKRYSGDRISLARVDTRSDYWNHHKKKNLTTWE